MYWGSFMYLKVTNEEENHNGLKYKNGLNIDPVPFAKEGSCCRGGIYFTTHEHILNFLNLGIYVREVTIPEDAEMVHDPSGDKWRASKIILGKRSDLRKVETWRWLGNIVRGYGWGVYGWDALRWASKNDYAEVLEYLEEMDIWKL